MVPRIAFFGGKPLSARCLRVLHNYHVRGAIEIAAVLPRPKGERGWWSGDGIPEMAETAEALQLPIIDCPEALTEIEVDLGLSVLHSSILPPKVFDHPRLGFLNLHCAPLPEYRGCNVCTFAILNGETRFGVTLHQIDEKPDHGPVLAICRFDVAETETARSLMTKTEQAGLQLFEQIVPDILEAAAERNQGAFTGKPLHSFPATSVSSWKYYPRDAIRTDGFKEINLSWSAVRIDRTVRALDFPPFEPAYLIINERKIYMTTGTNDGLQQDHDMQPLDMDVENYLEIKIGGAS
ncbi:MAG: methionyl-tRNA formyltransferase [Phycisphaerae bacterium]